MLLDEAEDQWGDVMAVLEQMPSLDSEQVTALLDQAMATLGANMYFPEIFPQLGEALGCLCDEFSALLPRVFQLLEGASFIGQVIAVAALSAVACPARSISCGATRLSASASWQAT